MSISLRDILTRVDGQGGCLLDLTAALSIGQCETASIHWPGQYKPDTTTITPEDIVINIDVHSKRDEPECETPVVYKPDIELDILNIVDLDIYLSLLDLDVSATVDRLDLLTIIANLDIDLSGLLDLDLDLTIGLGSLLDKCTASDLKGLLGNLLGGVGGLLNNLLNVDAQVKIDEILELIINLNIGNKKPATIAAPVYKPHCDCSIDTDKCSGKVVTIPTTGYEHCLYSCQKAAAESTIGVVADVNLLNIVDIDLCLAIDLFNDSNGAAHCTYQIGPKKILPSTDEYVITKPGHKSFCLA